MLDTALGVRPTVALSGGVVAERLGVDITWIVEVFQETGSFKYRAASSLVATVPQRQILAASSGNFGQALAAACRRLGKQAIVLMPAQSARVKIEAVRYWGGKVVFVDTTVMSRAARLAELAEEYPDAYVASAYDDWHVIRGNASLGREIAELLEFDAVVVPIGGGGLASGIALGLREKGSRARLWGAEPLLANDAARSLREGRRVLLEKEPPTLADGARTLGLGEKNWEILRGELSGILEVPETAIAEAVRLLFRECNLKVEPTGALAVAAVVENSERFRDQKVAVVLTGGNVDPGLYARLIEEPTFVREEKSSKEA